MIRKHISIFKNETLLKILQHQFSSSSLQFSETGIYALASGSQRSGLAVVRLSGKNSYDVLSQMTGKSADKLYEPRKMYLKDIIHPITKDKIDKGLVVWFKEPNSFTGENVCEFHIHGGPAVIQSLFGALSSFENLRYAQPGEFSKRAFMNERMDLVEIEGLVDLINAETEMQRKQALAQMEGSLSVLYKKWRQQICKCLANVEAYIDFYEEENLEENILEEVDASIENLVKSIETHLNDNRKGERLRTGVQVVIIGQPNAGKSSLLNKMCKSSKAIVSPIPGTTRDIIESTINIDEYPIIISDTAGLRKSNDEIEVEGVKRTLKRIESADIIIIVVDTKQNFKTICNLGIDKFIIEHFINQLEIPSSEIIEKIKKWISDKKIIVSLNKKDLLSKEELDHIQINSKSTDLLINTISCVQDKDEHEDINELLKDLKLKLNELCSNTMLEMPALTQQRHRENLQKCINCLKSFKIKKDDSNDLALIGEELRQAVKWIGFLTGQVTTDEILDVIFRDFCIGK